MCLLCDFCFCGYQFCLCYQDEDENEENNNQLIKLKYADDNIPLFSLQKKVFKAKIVRVYDGDTCFAVFFLNDSLVKFKIRMEGYDTPEIKPRLDIENRLDEIEKAKKAKQELERLILNQIVFLHCGGWDKYGRLLATIYTETKINVNQHMIELNFGKEYYGGKK